MSYNTEDSRQTLISVKSSDFDIQNSLIYQIEKHDKLNLDLILQICEKSSLIRLNYGFIERLFHNEMNIVIQMIDWMLSPNKMVKTELKKQSKKNNREYPVKCCNFINQNEVFFGKMAKMAKPPHQKFCMDKWFEFILLENKDQSTFDTSIGYFSSIMLSFLELDQLWEEEEKKPGKNSTHILFIFKQSLINQIMFYCHYQGIFKFIYRLALRCFEQGEVQSQKGQQLIEDLFHRSCSNEYAISHMVKFLNQTYWNITEDSSQNHKMQKHSIKILAALVKVNLVQDCVKKVIQSPLCYTGPEFKVIDGDEQQKIQDCFKILKIMVKIYRQKSKESTNDISSSGIFQKLKQKVKCIIDSMTSMVKIVQKIQQKTIKFSSGQEITPITLVKYQYFQLLLQCLILIQECPKNQFQINMDEMQIFPVIQRYLSENRWNNTVHHCLEKIVACLVSNNSNFFIKSHIQKCNITDGLLGHLIQSFRNKMYVFLGTFSQITEGNIHSLFKITYSIAKQLNSQQLKDILSKFELWKQFIKTDLVFYSERLAKSQFKVSQQELAEYNKFVNEEAIQLKIDQSQNIKTIIKKINEVQNWQAEENKRKWKRKQRKMYSSVVDSKTSFQKKTNDLYTIFNYNSVKPKKKVLTQSQKQGQNDGSNQSLTSPPILFSVNAEESIDMERSQQIPFEIENNNNLNFNYRQIFRKDNPTMVKSFQNETLKQQQQNEEIKHSSSIGEGLYFSGCRK